MRELRPRILAMGDSVTFGVGDGVQWPDRECGWAAHVASALGAASYVNIAHNGVRARHLMGSQVPLAVAREPDIVLMTVGGNDVLRGDFSPAEIAASLKEVFSRLAAPGRDIVMVSLDRIRMFRYLGRRLESAMNRRVAWANAAIADACAAHDVHVIDGSAAFDGLDGVAWHIDRLHPSPVGHRAIAERALDVLETRWERIGSVRPPRPRAALAVRAGWLAVYGAPWIARRSLDLVPKLAATLRREVEAERDGVPMGYASDEPAPTLDDPEPAPPGA